MTSPSRVLELRRQLSIVLLAITGAAATASDLRYALQPGDLFVYEHRAVSDPPGVPAESVASGAGFQNTRVRVWCLGSRGDRLRMLVDWHRVAAGNLPALHGAILLEMDAAGRYTVTPELAARLEPDAHLLEVLPPLPIAGGLTTAWGAAMDVRGYEYRYERAREVTAPEATQINFSMTESTCGPGGTVGGGQFAWDGQKAISGTSWLTEGTGTTTRHTWRLIGTRRQTPAWAERRQREADRLLQTWRSEDRLLRELLTQPEQRATTFAQLDRIWAAFGSDTDAADGSPLAELASARRSALYREQNTIVRDAGLVQRWTGTPVRPWTLPDLAGKARTSEELRRGVVLEICWDEGRASRRALAALGALRERDVQVLGYAVHRDPQQMQPTAAQCAPDLEQIWARPLLWADGLTDADLHRLAPLVRVVDRNGRIRGVWFCWRPDQDGPLRLARELVAEPAPPSPRRAPAGLRPLPPERADAPAR